MSTTHELQYREQARQIRKQSDDEVEKELDSNVKDEPLQQQAGSPAEPVSEITPTCRR